MKTVAVSVTRYFLCLESNALCVCDESQELFESNRCVILDSDLSAIDGEVLANRGDDG